jgi:hypothetical protein
MIAADGSGAENRDIEDRPLFHAFGSISLRMAAYELEVPRPWRIR